MKVLIIGGSGFIGSHVARQLSEAGHSVSVFHRGLTGTSLPPEVHSIHGDRRQLSHFTGEFARLAPEVVVDMIPLVEADAQVVMQTFCGRAGRVVAISSQDVYRAYGIFNGSETGPVQPTPLAEDAALRSVLYPYRSDSRRDPSDPNSWMDDYDKIPVERTIMTKSELAGTILRLPMVYGPGDRQHRMYEHLKRMDDGRPAILLERCFAEWKWTRGYVEDIAAGIALAAIDRRAAGRIYNLGEQVALSLRQWIEAIGAAVGWKGKVMLVDSDRLPAHLAIQANANQDIIADTSHIRSELGYREGFRREEALLRTIAWERNNPPKIIDTEAFNYAAEEKALEALIGS